jgi:arginase family enzyme
MGRTIAQVGVPASLGSYGPGQEKAPQVLRDAGFPEILRKDGAWFRRLCKRQGSDQGRDIRVPMPPLPAT